MDVIRVYRVKAGRRVVAVLFALAGVLYLVEASWALLFARRLPEWLALGSAVFFALFGLGWMTDTFQTSIVMSPEWIEVRRWHKSQRLAFARIRGRRERLDKDDRSAPKIRAIRIEAEGGELESLEFERIFAFDEDFLRWYEGLRDLDREEEQEREAGVVAIRGEGVMPVVADSSEATRAKSGTRS
jgi:hypothetical protein